MQQIETEVVERCLARIGRYVEQESPSHDVARCTALAQTIGSDLEALGARVTLVDAPGAGAHVLAQFPHEHDTEHVLILCHLDTVHPVGTLQTQPFATVGERVTGPGVFDMKSGAALMVEALATLRANGVTTPRPVRMLVTCDEETGSHTSRELIEAQARGAHAVLVPEPSLPGGKAKTARKGVAAYQLRTFGRAAHAGIEPERGINAILEIARQIVQLSSLADPQRGTTIGVGTISGGTSTNVVPAEASAAIDVRFAEAAERDRVERALHALAPTLEGARLEVVQTDTRAPLERSAGVIALFVRAREIAAELGVALEEGSTGGGSDGCLTAALGAPTLDGIGPQGGGAHATTEHILLGDIAFRHAFYVALLERL